MVEQDFLPIFEIGNVLVSADILTQNFCCDLSVCKGACCIEGDAGAPVTLDEVVEIETVLDTVWQDMSAGGQAIVDKQGVAYTDEEGDLVTSIVNGKDCVFTCYDKGCCLCALEKAYRAGKTSFCKPVSCALYPIREIKLSDGRIGLNYHRWKICQCAVDKGNELNLPIYKFLKGPLKRRFGTEWYDMLCEAAKHLERM